MSFAREQELRFIYRSIAKKRFLRWLIDTFGEGVLINPHVVEFHLVSQVVNAFLAGKTGHALGISISDENKEIAPDVEKSIRLLRGVRSALELDHIIEKGFFIDSSTSLVLQLCDLCTFAARKKEEASERRRLLVRSFRLRQSNLSESFCQQSFCQSPLPPESSPRRRRKGQGRAEEWKSGNR